MDTVQKLFLATRKGLIIFNYTSGKWVYDSTHFPGIPVSISYVDPRTHTWWACLDHGHWGVKLHRSNDEGKSWVEIGAPRFEHEEQIREGEPAAVNYIWSMAQGGKDKPGVLYIGTDPGGLFISEDNGDHWSLVKGLWEHPSREKGWFGGGRDQPGIHSIVVNPQNSDEIQVGISVAGVFKTVDGGKTWNPSNKGLTADFLPDKDAEVGQDPHLLVGSPTDPDTLWQQNHCGIFVTRDGSKSWVKVSQEDGPADFGFAIAVDETTPERAWVVPGISDEIRVAVDQKLCVCRTYDGGETWTDFRAGLPQENCFDIVYRHALSNKANHLAFGTTTGNVFTSNDHGETWTCLSNYLPMIYGVEII